MNIPVSAVGFRGRPWMPQGGGKNKKNPPEDNREESRDIFKNYF